MGAWFVALRCLWLLVFFYELIGLLGVGCLGCGLDVVYWDWGIRFLFACLGFFCFRLWWFICIRFVYFDFLFSFCVLLLCVILVVWGGFGVWVWVISWVCFD